MLFFLIFIRVLPIRFIINMMVLKKLSLNKKLTRSSQDRAFDLCVDYLFRKGLFKCTGNIDEF